MKYMHIRAMRLKAWLRETDTLQGDFAERVGVDRSMISKIASGQSLPGSVTAYLIENATAGNVKLADHYEAHREWLAMNDRRKLDELDQQLAEAKT